MTTKTTTIELPRLPDESARAYAARVEYVTMGPQRSLDRLSQKSTKNIQLFKRWSTQYGWQDAARQYDEQVSYLTVQEAAAAYRADLEEHRQKAKKAGQSLYIVAGTLLQQLNDALGQPRKVEGKDGRIYTLHGIELNTATLTTVSRALQTALDLEAHALGVEKLLPTLGDNDSE